MSTSKTEIRHWLGRHLLFWLVVMVGDSYLSYALRGPESNWLESLQATAIMWPYTMGLTYLALVWVLPSALAGRHDRFVRWAVIYVFGSWILMGLYRGYVVIPLLTGKLRLFPSYQEAIALLDWYIALVIVGVAVGIRLYRFWYHRKRANQQLAHETLIIELQVLKAQIHPHFLFNTLNNLYSLILKHSPQAPNMVLKLSGMLHYMIHDCNRPDVPLAKEVLFLENYIELEKLRYGPRLIVSMTVTGEISTNLIAPLLLIPFVENAFKHGSAQQTGQAHIEVVLVMTGREMLFRVENSKDEKTVSHTWQNTGSIGLANVQKRLMLLYPDAHKLLIRPERERFVVELTIQLDQKAVLIQQPRSAISSPY
ncbi:sensor histidine kinase [Spirosoma arcticum]